nr:putative reverse transcriptase domain-containing protein [Tanacetum cinerariifolium]
MFSLVLIIPLTMTTRSAGQPAAASRGGGTDRRVGCGGGRTRGRSGDQGNSRDDGLGGQVGGQGSEVNGGDQGRGQGDGRNQNDDAVNDNIRGDVSRGCTYKEFLACNLKEYDGKGGAIVYTRWIEKMESFHDMRGCRDSQRAKYTAGPFVGMVAATEPKTIQKAVQIAGTLTDEALKNGTIKKNPKKRENVGEPSKDKNGREDNKRTRIGNVFATTTNPVRRGRFAKDCRVALRNVNPINAKNPVARTYFECGSIDYIKSACPRINKAQRLGETNKTKSWLLMRVRVVENKKTRLGGCKLEIEGHVFDINLIPFGSGSFKKIIGMDWLSDYKAEIICHEKVVRIPLLDGKVLRVLGEKPKEKLRQLMSVKAKEKKQEEIVVVRDFTEVFPDDLSGLPPVQEIEFQIELVPKAMSVAKSPYHLTPSELEELSGQLKELQDKETYKNVSQDIRDQLNTEAEAVQIILTGIDNDIYSIVDACPNAREMWKAIERLKQGKLINVQDLETNLYWEFGKFTSQDGESLESYYSRVERIARIANPLALVAQQQPIYHPQTHHTHYTQNSLTRSQQAATRNREKVIVNSPQPIYDQEPSMVAEDDETSKDKEIDKLMDLISLSFNKIYKPTNNNLQTSSNTNRANQDNSPRINRSAGYENQRTGNVARARETVGSTMVQKSRIQCYNCKEFGHVVRECQKPKRVKGAAYHREKMLLCKQEDAGIQLKVEQADWRDDTDDDELEDQKLEAHYMYMAQLQEVSPDAADSGPIFDDEPLQKRRD